MTSELERSAGEGIGYPHQYSWASLVAQTIKNLPAVQIDPGSIFGLGKSPREGNGYPLQYSYLEIFPWTEESGGLQCLGSQRVGHS